MMRLSSSLKPAKKTSLTEKVLVLRKYVFADQNLVRTLKTELTAFYGGDPVFTVFLSVGNPTRRARVVSGSGLTLEKAWATATSNALQIAENVYGDSVWVKADIVNHVEKISAAELPARVKAAKHNEFFRYSISLDANFDAAFLEAEINGNKLLDYKSPQLLPTNINDYLKYNHPKKTAKIAKIPQYLWLFTCRGYMYDEGKCHTLNFVPDVSYGRRAVEKVDATYANMLIKNAVQFLSDRVQEDGQFSYGWFAAFDKPIPTYNIVRHASTIWSLIMQYKLENDATLLSKIDRVINYLLSAIELKDNDTAFVVERISNEIKLGGNAVAIIALTTYREVFGTTKYDELLCKLGNGILAMLSLVTGKYTHVLFFGEVQRDDYAIKEELRTVYYDGESTFALAKLYGIFGEQKWLDAATAAVEHFIRADYVKHRDHWVAYSMNEITKYKRDERYFEFALRNANENLDVIYNQKTPYHTYMELLTITFELYDRILREKIELEYLAKFDVDYFIKTIFHRAEHMLNTYFYPEYAMYLQNPARILHTFFVRHQSYRVRIDDVQHFVGGYYTFSQHYERLTELRKLREVE